MALDLSCNWCSYRCKAKLDLIKHCFGAHSIESTFVFKCGIRGCLHQFHFGTNFCSFKTHADRKHPNWRKYINNSIENSSPLPAQHTRDDEPEPGYLSSTSDEDEPEPNSPTCSTSDSWTLNNSPEKANVPSTEHTAALFILTLKEKYKLSQKAVDYAVGSVNTIVGRVCDSIQESVLEKESDCNAVDMLSCFDYTDPFSCLQTEYQQSKFYREEFGLIVSYCC